MLKYLDVVKYLIANGANVNAKYCDDTALICASKNGHFEIVEYLARQYGADVSINGSNGWNALIWASLKGYFEIVKILAKNSADANIKYRDYDTAFRVAKTDEIKAYLKQFLKQATYK